MSISRLDEFESIGWDFDGTIHDHPKSQLMHAYIRDNPEKSHYIVTFRSHGMEKRVWDELAQYPDAPGADAFVEIINMSNDMFVEGYMSQSSSGQSIVIPTLAYKEWKGKVCSENGIGILIDDMTHDVFPGCNRYGVVHIHPDDL